MALTWESVRARVVGVVTVTAERPSGLSGVTAGGARVWVDLARGAHADWLVLRSPICRVEEMDPRLSLERSGELAFSAIALWQDEYFFRVAVPVDSVEAGNPAQLVTLVVDAAESLRPRVGPHDFDARTLFGHYGDG